MDRGDHATDEAVRGRPSSPSGSVPPVGVWLTELARVPRGLVDAYVPGGGGVDARTREQLILAVSEVNGCRTTAWVHGAWLDFLGARDLDDELAPLLDYARACAEAGEPLDATTLEASFPPSVVRTVRATVARAQLATVVGGSADDLVDRIAGARSPSLPAIVRDASVLAASAPLAVPTVLWAGTMRVLARLAPALPEIELAPASEANLVAHLLAEAAPTYLGHAFVRTAVVWSLVPLAIAFRMEGTSATIRAGRGRVVIDNGIAPDALLVVDGGIEPLLRTVAGSILRDLGVPVRRPR